MAWSNHSKIVGRYRILDRRDNGDRGNLSVWRKGHFLRGFHDEILTGLRDQLVFNPIANLGGSKRIIDQQRVKEAKTRTVANVKK